jgi:hypothetical protein
MRISSNSCTAATPAATNPTEVKVWKSVREEVPVTVGGSGGRPVASAGGLGLTQ